MHRLRKVVGAYCVAEGSGFAHHWYVKRRARGSVAPLEPVDEDYGRQFLSLAKCDGQGSDPLACRGFVRHAFFGTPPEALSREAVHRWLSSHLGSASADAVKALESCLGPYAPKRQGTCAPACFVYGQGVVEAWYKPLLLRCYLEAQRALARRRLRKLGFRETQDPKIPKLSYWENSCDVDEPMLVVLHGYGRGLASPLFEDMLPALERRRVLIVDCGWLLATRVPLRNLAETPTVRQIAEQVSSFLARRGEVDLLAHSFGTAVASALLRQMAKEASVSARRVVLMDPMCFIPGISKQAQLLQRSPKDLAAELLSEIPAAQLRRELAGPGDASDSGGVMWLPTVGHGACQHREDVTERIRTFLSLLSGLRGCWLDGVWQILSSSGSGRWTTETSGGEKRRPKKMTILHFNDVYNVEGRVKEPVGGIARFVTRIRELKAESMARGEHEAVVLFSGDAFNPSLMPSPWRPRPQKPSEQLALEELRHMVKALNAVGGGPNQLRTNERIHTACYGNHDFDFGVDQLEEPGARGPGGVRGRAVCPFVQPARDVD
ncbi:unnamed protein product [Effrenium voratum]|nr:unnamed protein product [Effrenium voratum]